MLVMFSIPGVVLTAQTTIQVIHNELRKYINVIFL